MDVGIFGPEKSGKTTLFCLLSGVSFDSVVSKHEPNRAVAEIRDPRLDKLQEIQNTEKKVYTTLNLVDIPGFPAACPAREKNRIMQNLQGSDALLAVVRAFRSEIVSWPEVGKSAAAQLESISAELLLRDMEVVSNRLQRIEDHVGKRKLTAEEEKERVLLRNVSEQLDQERFAGSLSPESDERRLLASLSLFTCRPVVVAANLDEDQYSARDYPDRELVMKSCEERGFGYVEVAGRFEMEVLELPLEERELFMNEAGISGSCFERLHDTIYKHLDIITFFTFNEEEVRAWQIEQDTTAKQAAGKVHSDLMDHFIKAEIISYEDFVNCGGIHGAREKGLAKIAGKDEIIRDGDIVRIRANA